MKDLFGRFRFRALLCRVFGHWWETWMCHHGPYLYFCRCRNCESVMYAPKLPDPPRPPTPRTV